jgi:hypothetical protein
MAKVGAPGVCRVTEVELKISVLSTAWKIALEEAPGTAPAAKGSSTRGKKEGMNEEGDVLWVGYPGSGWE